LKGLVALGFSRAQKALCWIIFIKLKSHCGGKGNKLRELIKSYIFPTLISIIIVRVGKN
jgi:hypothetical protein